MTQFEFYKSFQFVAELLIAETLFSLRLTPRSKFYLRAPLCIAAVFLLSFLFPVPVNNAFYASFVFFAIFAFTVAMGAIMFKENILKLVFCLLAGYTVQHLAYELYNLIIIIMGANKGSPMGFYGDGSVMPFHDPFIFIMYVWVYFMTYFFTFLLFGNKIKRGESLRAISYIFIFAALLLVVDIVLNAVIVYNIAANGNKLYLTIVGVYNIVCCIIVLLLMFEVAMRHKLQDTLHSVNLLRMREKEQYELSKENIALINMKCHDLKHRIRNISGVQTLSEDSVKEIADAIKIYDSVLRTGNDALDVILTEKMLLCNKNGIKLSCIADGASLNFMSEDDIYSLFGNIIDNAIEAVQKLDEGKRVIGFKVRAVQNLLSVNVHNYYDKRPEFVGGIPQTTKEDKNYHGYGMKSVQYICAKYGADLSITAENNIFNINILFSLNPS